MKILDAFSDEKGNGGDRYWAVSMVTGTPEECDLLRDELAEICQRFGLQGIEWKDVTGDGRRTQAAMAYIEAAVAAAVARRIRIDVIGWDRQDSRHAIVGRDDIANMEIMYYRVFVGAGRRWGCSDWRFFPDEHTAIHWDELCDVFEATGLAKRHPHMAPLLNLGSERFVIHAFDQMASHEEPLVQLADLFAGLWCFSMEESQHLVAAWKQEKSTVPNQLSLSDGFDELCDCTKASGSRSTKVRCQVACRLKALSAKHRLGVGLESNGYFKTHDPANPINFWFYAPQHQYDKAPTKQRERQPVVVRQRAVPISW